MRPNKAMSAAGVPQQFKQPTWICRLCKTQIARRIGEINPHCPNCGALMGRG